MDGGIERWMNGWVGGWSVQTQFKRKKIKGNKVTRGDNCWFWNDGSGYIVYQCIGAHTLICLLCVPRAVLSALALSVLVASCQIRTQILEEGIQKKKKGRSNVLKFDQCQSCSQQIIYYWAEAIRVLLTLDICLTLCFSILAALFPFLSAFVLLLSGLHSRTCYLFLEPPFMWPTLLIV